MRFLVTLSVALVLFAGCKTTRTATSPTKLVGGAPASDSQFPAVMIWTTADVALHESYCTGTKVAADLILTAAHCVLLQDPRPGQVYLGPWRKIDEMNPGRRIQYTFQRNLENYQPKTLELVELLLPDVVERCVENPDDNPDLCQFREPIPDVALLKVRPEGAFADRPVVPVAEQLVSPGAAVHIMGYGSEGETVTARPRLKFAKVEVAGQRDLTHALSTTFAAEDGYSPWNSFFGVLRTPDQPVNLGSGDSGGPVFDAQGTAVVGVNSDGFCPLTNRYCQETSNSIFARIDKGAAHGVADWLRGHLGSPR